MTGCFSRTQLGPTVLFFHQSHLGDLLDSLGFRVGGFRIERLRLRVRTTESLVEMNSQALLDIQTPKWRGLKVLSVSP